MEGTLSDSPIQQKWKKINYSVDPIPTLPSEIIQEILLRLPVKSLLKFRCVSKLWLSLISSPEFRKAHLEISTNDPNFTFHRIVFSMSCRLSNFNFNNCSVRSLLYEPMPDGDGFSITYPQDSVWFVGLLGSCNGLICISIHDEDLFLWNPSIRKSKKLPEFNIRLNDPDVRRYVNIIFGFGFDETENDYKVLRVFCAFDRNDDPEIVGSIYSSKTNSWRRINELNLIHNAALPQDPVIFVQGKLHWRASTGLTTKWNIISFDLGNETCGIVEQPNYGEGKFYSHLGVVGGCICVVCDFEKTRADVWVLKDYHVKESWTKVVSIPYLDDPGSLWYYKPLCISPNGDILLALGGSLMVYNMKENSFRYPQIGDVNIFNTYVESLVSPDTDADGE